MDTCRFCYQPNSWHQGLCGAELAYRGYSVFVQEEKDRKAEWLAREFHELYERLAPIYGYKTREETREFKPESNNGKLMIAVCREILNNKLGGL